MPNGTLPNRASDAGPESQDPGYDWRDPQEPMDDHDDYDGEYDGGENNCWDCGGRGWKITCIDDLCHGGDFCIHGDPPTPCRTCNPKGDRFDDF